jgi:hypothetical protein
MPITPALMAPRVYHEEYEHHKPEDQQNNGAWFVVPELLNAPGDILEIHSFLSYTRVS